MILNCSKQCLNSTFSFLISILLRISESHYFTQILINLLKEIIKNADEVDIKSNLLCNLSILGVFNRDNKYFHSQLDLFYRINKNFLLQQLKNTVKSRSMKIMK